MTKETINGEMVTVARESRGISQKELASKLTISAAQLSRIEVGLRSLKDDELQEKLVEVLDYPKEFFFQKHLVYGIGVSEVFHRKRQSVSDRVLNKIYAQIYLRTTELSKMIRNTEAIKPLNIHPININDYDCDSTEIARIVRAYWKIPRGPIKNLVNVIEDAGGVVFPFDFETNSIDAISHWPHNGPPVFFINRYNPSDRVRFTLAHELAHIVMHRTVEPNSEEQADKFAAEFLMPQRDIKLDLSDVSLPKLAILKPVWRVSMAALLKRASDLELITPRHARTLWMQMSQLGYRTYEPPETHITPEQPNSIQQLIAEHFDALGYSIKELSHLLCLTESEARDIYIEPRQSMKRLPRKPSVKEESKSAISEIEDMLKNTRGENN